MNKERELYNKFVDKLLTLLENPDITEKELRVILNFLDNNNIQADLKSNKGLQELADNFELDLPFEVEELPQR